MAGIYLHIPFCKARCIYCDFYSTTHEKLKQPYVEMLCRELTERKDYLRGEPIKTVYFGGGTPSLLGEEDFRMIFTTIDDIYGLEEVREVTLEANPDDLTPDYLQMLSGFPFNRVSMGIQTFDEATLRLLKRRHTAMQAAEAVENCRKAGFRNISIDLIYGLPGETMEKWEYDLRQAVRLDVEHISAYHLTYEEGTPIYNMLQRHQVCEVDEDSSLRFFALLMNTLTSAGYIHYEISNFCRPGRYARHNTAYWKGIPYLGCGASAHSFDGRSREWNVASLTQYIEGMSCRKRVFETEPRDRFTAYNEYVITAGRTMWGLSLKELERMYGSELREYCLKMAEPYLKSHKLTVDKGRLKLTRDGIFISDAIMSDLLFIEK